MSQRSMVLSAVIGLLLAAGGASAADVQAGKAKFDKICGDCHEPADYQGKSEAELQALIKGIVSGKVKHEKKLQLSDTEIADIAAHLAASAK